MTDIFEGVDLADDVKAALSAKLNEAFIPKTEFEAVKKKTDELLSETKAAKEKARQAEAERQEALRVKAEKDGDIETLKKVDAERIALLEGELNSIKKQNKKQKINGIAKEFVSQKFVEDDVVREAITEKFANRLDVRDERLIVLDIEGNPTGLDLKDLQNEFLNTDAHKRHLIATRATGGGANGGRSSGGAAKVISRTSFDSLGAVEKMEFVKSGGKVT